MSILRGCVLHCIGLCVCACLNVYFCTCKVIAFVFISVSATVASAFVVSVVVVVFVAFVILYIQKSLIFATYSTLRLTPLARIEFSWNVSFRLVCCFIPSVSLFIAIVVSCQCNINKLFATTIILHICTPGVRIHMQTHCYTIFVISHTISSYSQHSAHFVYNIQKYFINISSWVSHYYVMICVYFAFVRLLVLFRVLFAVF